MAALRQRGSKGYSAPKRRTAVYTTGTLAANASEQGTVELAVSYKLLRIKTSGDARVRLYDSRSSQVGDAPRAIGVDPGDGEGVIFEYVATTGLYSVTLSPLVSGTSTDTPTSKRIPITVTNTGAGSAAITVTLTWIEEE